MRKLIPGFGVLAASLALAANVPHLDFSKSFPGSAPAYEAITVEQTGVGSYQEAEQDPNPVRFQLTPAEVSDMFSLAAKLGYFDHPIESPAKVAFMGAKTFRYVNGAASHEVKFNYTEDPTAQALTDWFERIGESERLFTNLEVAAKYDRLGVDRALLLLGAAYDGNRLVALRQFLPLLDRIAKSEMYMHQDRLRAAGLADQFRAPK